MKRTQALVLGLAALCVTTACRSTADPSTPDRRAGTGPALDPRTGERMSLEELSHRLADYDVVFLGELHNSEEGHELQYELTRLLADRNGSVLVSLEMFERDVQADLDAYLRGDLDEDDFLDEARPWKDYDDFYRPVVEWARDSHRVVIAANVPRPLAARVAKQGLDSVAGEPYVPHEVHAPRGEYRTRFFEAMGGHGLPGGAEEFWYQAQCIKDDAMAESIVLGLERYAAADPIAVHWCGRFHSDYGLGTVERVKLRRPDLRCAVVTMILEDGVDGERLSDSDALRGDYAWIVAD